jgi:hypothetical protein
MENISQEHIDQLPKKGQIVWVRDSDDKRWGIAHFIDYYADYHIPYKVSQRNNPDDCVNYKCLRTTNPYEMSDKKQTAVDWFAETVLTNRKFSWDAIIEQAKQMEKEQNAESYKKGWDEGTDELYKGVRKIYDANKIFYNTDS